MNLSSNNENQAALIIQKWYKSILEERDINLKKYYNKIEPKIKYLLDSKNRTYKEEFKLMTFNFPERKKWAENSLKQKQLEMKEGKIQQIILGNFFGWVDLENNHETGLDIKNEENTIFIELKKNYNTNNDGNKKNTIRKFLDIKKKYPDARCILGIVNPKKLEKNNIKKCELDNIEYEEYQRYQLLELIFTYKNYNYSDKILNMFQEFSKYI
jgi:flagellar hook-associated protein FlgK